MYKLLLIFFLMVISCGYKAVNFKHKKLNVCIEKVNIYAPEAVVLDTLNQKITDSIISQGKKLDCSYRKDIILNIYLKSISFYSIGYSSAQRANVYKISMTINLKIENKEGKNILDKDITETTQYVGAGLRADIEKRYAIENLANLLQIRIYSLLSEIKN